MVGLVRVISFSRKFEGKDNAAFICYADEVGFDR